MGSALKFISKFRIVKTEYTERRKGMEHPNEMHVWAVPVPNAPSDPDEPQQDKPVEVLISPGGQLEFVILGVASVWLLRDYAAGKVVFGLFQVDNGKGWEHDPADDL